MFKPINDGLDYVAQKFGISSGPVETGGIAVPYTSMFNKYSRSWLARQIVDILIDDGVKNGIDETDLKLGVVDTGSLMEAYVDARKASRIYGWCIIVPTIESGILADDYKDKIVGKKVDGWRVISPPRLSITLKDMNRDFASKHYNKPESYLVSGTSWVIDKSNVVLVVDRKISDLSQSLSTHLGLPTLNYCLPSITAYEQTMLGVARKMKRSHIDTLKIEGLQCAVETSANGNVSDLIDYYATTVGMADSMGVMLIDGSDELACRQLTFAGVNDIITQFKREVCGASELAESRLFSDSRSGGLSAGDKDLESHSARVVADQNGKGSCVLYGMFGLMADNGFEHLKDHEIKWNNVTTQTPKEEAEILAADCASWATAGNSGLAPRSKIAEKFCNKYGIEADPEFFQQFP